METEDGKGIDHSVLDSLVQTMCLLRDREDGGGPDALRVLFDVYKGEALKVLETSCDQPSAEVLKDIAFIHRLVVFALKLDTDGRSKQTALMGLLDYLRQSCDLPLEDVDVEKHLSIKLRNLHKILREAKGPVAIDDLLGGCGVNRGALLMQIQRLNAFLDEFGADYKVMHTDDRTGYVFARVNPVNKKS